MSVVINRCFLPSSQGASGVGLGNFLEVGPLDVDLKPRNSTWLQKADLIFVVSQSSETAIAQRLSTSACLLPRHAHTFAVGDVYIHVPVVRRTTQWASGTATWRTTACW